MHNEYMTTIGDTVVRRVPAGTTVKTIGTGPNGFINKNGPEVTQGPYLGSQPCILIEDGATLCYTNKGTVWPMIVVTNGCHATIDMASGSTPSFCRGLVVQSNATLVIKGVTEAIVGSPGYTWGSTTKSFVDLRNVTFESTASTGGISIKDSFIISLPTNGIPTVSDRTVYKENGSAIARVPTDNILIGEDVFRGAAVTNLPTHGIYLANPKALGKSFRIPAGFEIMLKQFDIPELTLEYLVSRCNDNNNYETKAGTAYDVDFEFADETSRLTFADGLPFGNLYDGYTLISTNTSQNTTEKGSVCTGKLKGNGRLLFTTEASAQAALAGDASEFTGTVEVRYVGRRTDAATPYVTFAISNSLASASVWADDQSSFAFGSDDAPATIEVASLAARHLSAAAGVTVSPAIASGALMPGGAGSFAFTAMADGAVVLDDGVTAITYAGAETPANVLVASVPSVGLTAYGFPTDGEYDVAAFETTIAGHPHTIVKVPDGATVSATAASARLNLSEGESATVSAKNGNVTASVSGDGAFALDEPTIYLSDWKDSVTHWYDFGNKANMRRVTEGFQFESEDYMKQTTLWNGKACSRVERWVDDRFPDPTFPTLMNGIAYISGATVNAGVRSDIFPLAATNMYPKDTSLSYLAFHTASRFPFGSSTLSKNNDGIPLPMQQAIVVMNLNDGKCPSIFATATGVLARDNGLDKPFVKDAAQGAAINLRTNGVPVDAGVATPVADWQLLTVDLHGLKFAGLGFVQMKRDCDGKEKGQYAELLLFSNRVDDVTILQAEIYLARKWKLNYDFAAAEATIAAAQAAAKAAAIKAMTNTVVAIGSGTVTAGRRTLKLGGNFAGRLDLQGGRLILDGGAMPWTADDVPSGGREFWMDPDDAGTVYEFDTKATGAKQIQNITDKAGRSYAAGQRIMNAQGSRLPYLHQEARGFGPVRGWLDFNDEPGYGDTSGNCLRLRIVPEGAFDPNKTELPKAASALFGIQTAFFVQDSIRGGDSPLMDAVGGNAIQHRMINGVVKATTEMWPGTVTEFQNGENRLDGQIVDRTKGFGGKPEILTLRATSPYSFKSGIWTIESYQTTEDNNRQYGALLGETIFYSGALTDAEVSGIESYLMNKWLGYLPTGFTDARQATIGGTGAVEMASFATMPKIASDFSGTVTVGGDTGTLAVAVDLGAGTVSGALVNTGAAFTLPASVTVNVTCSGRLRRRSVEHRYTLLDADITSDTALTWNLTGAPAKATVVRTGTKYELVIPRTGFVMYVK